MRLPALRPVTSDATLGGALLAAGLLVWAGATYKFGLVGLALPLPLLLGVALLRWPGTVAMVAIAAAVLCENPDFGLFPWTGHLYDDIVKGFMPLDAILAIAALGTLVQIVQEQRSVLVPPPPLTLALLLLLLALASGVYVGRAGGASLTDAIIYVHVFLLLVVVPMVAVNLRVGREQIMRVLGVTVALGIVKALLGLLVVVLGKGSPVDGSVLTYYEPAANWIMTVAMLSILAAVAGGIRLPWWMLVGGVLMLVALVLSYRRSFWIADTLGILLVLLLGLSQVARLLLVPTAVLVGVAIWALGGVALQSDSPVGQRLSTLNSSKINAKPDDRYRIDERANVLHNITEHPIAGLGLGIPWHADKQPLPIEADPTHQYVHFAVLYWWLRLGILGMIAYAALIGAGVLMSMQVWRASSLPPPVRAFGLGSLCSMIALVVVETTTTFTGSDVRFTILLAGQLALLAVCVRQAASSDSSAVV
jgi:O-antigen ligase